MTHVANAPEDFAARALDGLTDAAACYVRRCPGGVVRAHPARKGKVAVVVAGDGDHGPVHEHGTHDKERGVNRWSN